jgi:hypothetical protein
MQTRGPDHFARGWFLFPRNDLQLGRFACPVDPDQTNAIARFNFPSHILEHFARGVNLTDMFKA